ncbi:unnamed protein product [Rangifer tarandus platyrhynchus]|uniref:Uncharacterized protein n=1 Tax=Rangifer tarandus platyrhynchus TaxID=3082113 RepID=A0ABN8XKD6_RANTA|nr:unnamed protein product [Rangifer tarandus platyrhynchus]
MRRCATRSLHNDKISKSSSVCYASYGGDAIFLAASGNCGTFADRRNPVMLAAYRRDSLVRGQVCTTSAKGIANKTMSC